MLESYLRALHDSRATGSATDETSYYPPLGTLLNTAGAGLSPAVHCVMNPSGHGAGLPDGAFFTTDQIPHDVASTDSAEAILQQTPARGVMEVKGPGENVLDVADTEQVSRYFDRYGQVLVTNYREFLLVVTGEDAKDGSAEPVRMEPFQLAESESALWEMAADDPAEAAEEHGERLAGYLRRTLQHGAPLREPQDVAWLLASYARDARIRLETAGLDDLGRLRSGLEEALGVDFESGRGERFFRATVVQTLFYGLFSAWVLWHRENPQRSDNFAWHGAAEYLRVPVIELLFHQLVLPSRLRRLRLAELMNWAAAALNRIDRPAFFGKFDEEDAVQYFYEPFLEAYDPALRKELGVWYTPKQIVRYQVCRVDTVLQDELGIADGLADDRVMVLDPCCGTGAYLVETLRLIAARLERQGVGSLTGADLKRAATSRIFGFEILTAPFVVAHLQIGLFLREQGVGLASGADHHDANRAGVYLTNALTGWDPAEDPQKSIFPELEAERDAADRIKQQEKILVVLGNPPYDGYAGMAVGEEAALTDEYRSTTAADAPDPSGQGLNDLYVRFFRIAERQIAEQTGRGVVCYISNYSWLDGLSHPGMRERYLDAFDRVWIDSLNGDKYRTGKTTPAGDPDPSVFSTERNRVGIQVGTAVALLARTGDHTETHNVNFRNFWGKGKRERLLKSADDADGYEAVEPPVELGYPFSPRATGEGYFDWPKLPALFPTSFPGVKTSRDAAVVDTDRDRLVRRMKHYFDADVPDEEIAETDPRLMKSTSGFDAKQTRRHLQKRGFREETIVRYQYRPMDVRWLYWEPETKLLDRERSDYFPHVFAGNVWMTAAKTNRKGYSAPAAASAICSLHVIERGSHCFPLKLNPDAAGQDLFSQPHSDSDDGGPSYNVSDAAQAYLAGAASGDADGDNVGIGSIHESTRSGESTPADTSENPTVETFHETSLQNNDAPINAETLFYHALAVLHAPAYRAENEGALRQDWPRVPLPAASPETADALRQSAALGRRVAALLDVEQDVSGVTAGSVREALRPIAAPTRAGGGQLDPSAGDLAVTAGWGYTVRSAVMPGQGERIERLFTDEEQAAFPDGYAERFGKQALDLYLNDDAYWKGVPRRVWDYTLGGYPVLKKWLSYRERDVLGRDLRVGEVRHFAGMARRIAALLALEPALDANYVRARSEAVAWEEVGGGAGAS